MELRHLRSFLAVVELQHFGRAAESLHLAQPALSRQVQQLEHELGVALLHRTTRRVTVTEAGQRLAAHARTVLGGVEETYADLALVAAGRAGRVSVGFVGTSTYDVLPRVAHDVRRELPEVELEVRGELLSPALVDALLDRTHDLALLRPGPDVPEGITLDRLRSERLVAALPKAHRLGGRRRIDLADLADEPFVTHPSGSRSSFQTTVLAACARAGFTPRVAQEAGETATLMVFVAAGLGVALVPEPVRSLGLEGVSYVALSRSHTVELALARRAEQPSPAVARVADIVRRTIT